MRSISYHRQAYRGVAPLKARDNHSCYLTWVQTAQRSRNSNFLWNVAIMTIRQPEVHNPHVFRQLMTAVFYFKSTRMVTLGTQSNSTSKLKQQLRIQE